MRVDVALLARHGVLISEDDAHRRFVGRTFEAMIEELAAETGRIFPPGLSAEKDRVLLDLYERELRSVPGVPEALAAIGGAPSVASNSPAARVEAALRVTGLCPHFGGRIVTFEHVAEGKPAPDIYLLAARRAGREPRHCIAIEDSVTGVTAAARAGCTVLGFTGTHAGPERHGETLRRAGAAASFAAMTQLPGILDAFATRM